MKNLEQRTYRIILEPDGKGYHAYAPALPGCHTQGRTLAEAKKNILEAMELYLEVLAEHGETIPHDESFETFQTVSLPRMRAKAVRRQYA